MTSPAFEEVKTSLKAKIDDLNFEALEVYERLVKPSWDIDTRRFYSTLYAYIMYCFSIIDLLSSYWRGNSKNQTTRIKDFIVKFLHYGEAESKFAVKLWRHTLIHTSQPRNLTGGKSGKTYKWLLHWYAELQREHHMKFQESDAPKILNMSLVYLVQDIQAGLDGFMNIADSKKLLGFHARLGTREFKEA